MGILSPLRGGNSEREVTAATYNSKRKLSVAVQFSLEQNTTFVHVGLVILVAGPVAKRMTAPSEPLVLQRALVWVFHPPALPPAHHFAHPPGFAVAHPAAELLKCQCNNWVLRPPVGV